MFGSACSFNQLLNWDTRNVTNMSYMFYQASSFNQLLNWDTRNVINMSEMFCDAKSFNQNLFNKKREKWAFVETQYLGNCKKLPTELIRLVAQFAFNSSWNMKNVTRKRSMFKKCPSLVYQ